MSQEGSNAIREDNGATGATPPSPDPFQPKKQSKLIRILTVIAYMLSVSMAAIFLSAYYIFMYDAQPTLAQKTYPVANALTQGPNFHQYEQYVYIKEKKILKDKGLLTSNLIQTSMQNIENNTDENGKNIIDINNENNTDSLINNKNNVEDNLFETEMHNNSDNNNTGFSLYRLYKRAMERIKENNNGKAEEFVNVTGLSKNEVTLPNSTPANETSKTKESSDREHVLKAIRLKQTLQINLKIPINNISSHDSNAERNVSPEAVFPQEVNFDYENNSTDVNLEQLLLNSSDTINKEY